MADKENLSTHIQVNNSRNNHAGVRGALLDTKSTEVSDPPVYCQEPRFIESKVCVSIQIVQDILNIEKCVKIVKPAKV